MSILKKQQQDDSNQVYNSPKVTNFKISIFSNKLARSEKDLHQMLCHSSYFEYKKKIIQGGTM
jgi:hypothetical protein